MTGLKRTSETPSTPTNREARPASNEHIIMEDGDVQIREGDRIAMRLCCVVPQICTRSQIRFQMGLVPLIDSVPGKVVPAEGLMGKVVVLTPWGRLSRCRAPFLSKSREGRTGCGSRDGLPVIVSILNRETAPRGSGHCILLETWRSIHDWT
jgi:hypothetical protein